MVKVREVMKKDVMKVSPEATLEQAAKIMTNNKVGSLIVIRKDDKPEDIVTNSDITTAVANGLNLKELKISDMRKKKLKRRPRLITVKPSDNIMKVTKLMVKNGVKRLPVVENGKLKGIIADKEILLISPELIEIMSEKLKNRVNLVPGHEETIDGICEDCGEYSDELRYIGGRWLCPECASHQQ